MNGSNKIKTILLISLLVLILGIIITGMLFLMISSNNQKSKIDKLDQTVSNLESTINYLQNNKETSENDIENENIIENINSKWTTYPKNMYEKICDSFGIEIDKDTLSYKLEEKTLYELIKKYANIKDSEFYDYYFDWGDSTKIIDIDSNYARYVYPDNENNDLSAKYTKKIKYSISEFNELYYDGYYSLEQCTKNQYNKLVKEKNYYHYENVPDKLYYSIGSVLVMNGNNESKEDFVNNSRAKKIKIIINDEKEYEIDLKDTNEIQIFNIGYKQDTIEHPVNIVVEVLEQYDGEKNNDVYISDIQFSIDSNIPQGR